MFTNAFIVVREDGSAKLTSSSLTGCKVKEIQCKGKTHAEHEVYAAGECLAWENRLAAKNQPSDSEDANE